MAASLGERLADGTFVTAPGVYDGLSARIAQQAGFGALYLTGYGVSASLLGKPDAGFLTCDDMTGRIAAIVEATGALLIADADTGFGDVAETVRAYQRAGAAALQIEDQRFPKRCGHTPGREVVDLPEAVERVTAAVEARGDSAMQIVARTDARTSSGLGAAIDRAASFAEAGADILFIESPESEAELRDIARALPGRYLLANMVAGGRTPFLAPQKLQDFGFHIAIYPVMGLAAAGLTLRQSFAALGKGDPDAAEVMPFAELNEVVGFPEIWAQDRLNESS